jgi:hypothetical protein
MANLNTDVNRNSALVWLPPVEAAGLPVPRTITVPYDHRSTRSIFGEHSDEFDRLVKAVDCARESFGDRSSSGPTLEARSTRGRGHIGLTAAIRTDTCWGD